MPSQRNWQFRRANAIYFGCALVVRSAVTERGAYEDIYHFVCVFCTNENDMTSNYKKTPKDQPSCPSLTARGGEHPHLCRRKHFSKRSNFLENLIYQTGLFPQRNHVEVFTCVRRRILVLRKAQKNLRFGSHQIRERLRS